MTARRRAVDFDDLVEQMRDDVVSLDDWPTVVGGECSEAQLMDWLNDLDLSAMDVRIWWFTDHATIGRDGPPGSAELLERARLFGKGGDLDVRRDGTLFRWRYIGEAQYAPQGDSLEYPGSGEAGPVCQRERKALLWGTRENGQEQWFDDRVSGAKLTYFPDPLPLPQDTEERVKVQFREYTQAGQTVAVWLVGLEKYREAKNG